MAFNGLSGSYAMYRRHISNICLKSRAEDDGKKASIPTKYCYDLLQRISSALQYLVIVTGKYNLVIYLIVLNMLFTLTIINVF